MQAADEVHSLAQQTTETAGRLDELIAALETATAERDLARQQLLVCFRLQKAHSKIIEYKVYAEK